MLVQLPTRLHSLDNWWCYIYTHTHDTSRDEMYFYLEFFFFIHFLKLNILALPTGQLLRQEQKFNNK